MADQIKDGVVVTMAYRMIVDGAEVETAPADDPLYYLHGHDNIVPGLEAALAGKTVGDKLSVTLDAVDAYGEYDDEAVLVAPVEDFELPAEVTIGDEVEVEDADGELGIAVITNITDKNVTMDFNEPFAGKTVTFEVEVLALRDANEDELEWGEPAEYGDIFGGEDHDHDEAH